MKLKLRTMGEFQKFIGVGETEINFDGKTLKDFLGYLKGKYELDMSKYKNSSLMLVNGSPKEDKYQFKEEDTIAMLPIFGGG